jgi:hypothetical protein
LLVQVARDLLSGSGRREGARQADNDYTLAFAALLHVYWFWWETEMKLN